MHRIIALPLLAFAVWIISACYPILTYDLATPEPLVPTPLLTPPTRTVALPRLVVTGTPSAADNPGGRPVPTPARPAVMQPPTTHLARASAPRFAADRARIGVGMPLGKLDDYAWGASLPVLYPNWRVEPLPVELANVHFVQMVRLFAGGFRPDLAVIAAAARAAPGMLWLIGNEPDVIWQDNVTPEQYATSYGILYRAIKEADPSAEVAIGGVSVPTRLRMAYLERILAAYRELHGTDMPVDVWNVHTFILREERASWGVGIPPGMATDRGELREIGDHADMAIFRGQVEDFRRWMAEQGLRDKPLIVSEYGILMPAEYGFPPEVVGRFMADTFDYFLNARDPQIGYPADGDRLVQAFCWYSVADTVYPTPNLFDPKTRQPTILGELFRAYVGGMGDQ